MIMLIGKLRGWGIFLFLFMITFVASAQNSPQTVLRDAYGIIVKEWNDSSLIYINKKGKEYKIPLNGICYKGGDSALKRFVYKTIKKEYECNVREIFIILFNQNLKIEEIRIAYNGINIESQKCKHRKEYIRALKETRGMWIKKIKNQKNYVYIISMHIN